jgi:HEPN domain-containing protein
LIPRSRAGTWLAQAANDVAHAQHAYHGRFYSQACYGAQQAVEKALKALLLHTGKDGGRTRSILGLRQALQEAGIEIPEEVLSLQAAQELTRHNIDTRYPLGDGEDAPFELFGDTQAKASIDCAIRVVELARSVVPE